MSTEVSSSLETVGNLVDKLFDICEYDSDDLAKKKHKKTAAKKCCNKGKVTIKTKKIRKKLIVSESRKLRNRTSYKIRFEKGSMNSDDVLRRLQKSEEIEISCIVLKDKFKELNDIFQMEFDEFTNDSLKNAPYVYQTTFRGEFS